MKTSELIETLQKCLEDYGDVDVMEQIPYMLRLPSLSKLGITAWLEGKFINLTLIQTQ